MDIRSDKKVREFFLKKDLKESSRKKYIEFLNHYIQSAGDGLTPTELIQEALTEEREGIYPEDRKLEERLLQFKSHLLEHDYTDLTRHTIFNKIKTFYRGNHIREIPPITIKVKRQKQITIDDLPSRDDIYNGYLAANIRFKPIILLGSSSGLSMIDIRHLTVQEYLDGVNKHTQSSYTIDDLATIQDLINKKEICIPWKGNREKNEIEYLTYCTPETTKSILQYLLYDPPGSTDDYLFRWKGHKLQNFDKYYNRLNKRISIDHKPKHSRLSSHNLRRRFGSLLNEVEIGYRQVEYFMGHVLPSTQRAYYKLPSEAGMFDAYLRALPLLSILEPVEIRVVSNERLLGLEERIKHLEWLLEKKERLDTYPKPQK